MRFTDGERKRERDKKDSWKTARVKGGLAGSVNTLKPFIYLVCVCVRARSRVCVCDRSASTGHHQVQEICDWE